MRFRHYIYPLIFFLILWLIGAGISANHRKAIADLINTAGRNREPIVVKVDYSVPFSSGVSLMAFNTDPIAVNTNHMSYTYNISFDETGTLYIHDYNYASEISTYQSIRFPDYKSTPAGTYQFTDSTTDPIAAWAFFSKWQIELGILGFTITDILTGEERYIEFETAPPWESEFMEPLAYVKNILSSDGQVLFTYESDNPFTGSPGIWRYDIQPGTWTLVCEIKTSKINYVSVGPEGDLIAVLMDPVSSGSGSTLSFPLSFDSVFLDGRSGEELHRESNSFAVTIGQRWAIVASVGTGMGSMTLIALDLENGFAKTSFGGGFLGSIALYEPPPNGLDGMYENYVPEDN
jgi:hypothetical protein